MGDNFWHNYGDQEYEAGRESGIAAVRQDLAATLTRLHASIGPDTQTGAGYHQALADIAKAHGLRTKTETVVKFVR
jgi:hypothetical protein